MASIDPTYPICSARLLLRPFEMNDLQDLHDIYMRPEVVRYLYTDIWTLDEAREATMRRASETRLTEEGKGLVLAVVPLETGRVVGEVVLKWLSERHRQGEIGFIVHPEAQGKGYATEAARVMLELGFNELRLHRICGRCDARNVGSAGVMERLGMRREAHFIHNEIFKGDWGKELLYAILESEWREQAGASASRGAFQ